jgi:YD repeat-containing protein
MTTSAFDAVGNRQTFKAPSSTIVTHQFDALGRLATSKSIDGKTTTFLYDQANQLTLKTLPNGTRCSSTYDGTGQLSEISNQKSDSTVISDIQFMYDPVGNRTVSVEETGDRVTWGYDRIDQLVDDQRSGSNAYRRTFTFDPVGNCLVKDVNGAFTTSVFDVADQLVTAVDLTGTNNYGFDANGNQNLVVSPSGARTTSNWSYENQVELIILPSGGRVTAVYNAENRRTRLQS